MNEVVKDDAVASDVEAGPPDARALPAGAADVRLTCSADAMHGRCFGFEAERERWEAPRLAVHSSAEARPGYASMSKSEYLDTEATLRAKVRQLSRLLREARRPVFYCGAGLSTAVQHRSAALAWQTAFLA